MAARQTFSSLFTKDDGKALSTSFKFANEAMQSAMAKAQEAKTVRLAEAAQVLITQLDAHNEALLRGLRTIRKQERDAKDKLEKFGKAAQHFAETGNFGPLYPFLPSHVAQVCHTLGVDMPSVEDQKLPA